HRHLRAVHRIGTVRYAWLLEGKRVSHCSAPIGLSSVGHERRRRTMLLIQRRAGYHTPRPFASQGKSQSTSHTRARTPPASVAPHGGLSYWARPSTVQRSAATSRARFRRAAASSIAGEW